MALVLMGSASWGPSGPCVSYAQRAHAQSPTDATQRPLDAETRAIFDAGQTAFAAHRFEAALDAFQRAHARSGRPAMLFNIGATAERLGRPQQALLAYEAYVAALPDAPNRRAVDARIAALRDSVGGATRASASPPAAPASPASPASPADPSVTPARPPSSPVVPTVAAAPNADPHATPTDPLPSPSESALHDRESDDDARIANPGRVAGTVATGVVVAGAGAVLVALAARDRRYVEDADVGTPWERVSDEHDRAPRRSAIGMTLIGVGAAATVTGVALAITSRVRRGHMRDERPRVLRAGLGGTVTPQRVEVSAWTRF